MGRVSFETRVPSGTEWRFGKGEIGGEDQVSVRECPARLGRMKFEGEPMATLTYEQHHRVHASPRSVAHLPQSLCETDFVGLPVPVHEYEAEHLHRGSDDGDPLKGSFEDDGDGLVKVSKVE